jgi:hypothetical protein
MLWVFTVIGVAVAVVVVAVAVRVWLSVKTLRCMGLRCKGGVIYYRSTVSADEAQRLREFLERSDFFNPTQPAVEMEKERGVYHFRLPVTEEVHQDEEALVRYAVVAAGLSDEVFAGATVEVHLCDGWLRSRTVVPHCGKFGERFRFNGAQLFYTPGVTENEAIRLGTFLMGQGFFNDGPKLGQFNRTAGGFELRLRVQNESALGPAHRAEFQRMASDLSQDVFGVPVEVCPCEGVRKTLDKRVSNPERQPDRNPNRVWIGPVTFRIPNSPTAQT